MKRYTIIILFISCLCQRTSFAIKTKVPFNLLRQLLPENPTILEAGGHIGQDTKWMSTFWPKGNIHVFEPHPNLYRILTGVAQDLTNVRLYPFCLIE